jgi:hypothetical protein
MEKKQKIKYQFYQFTGTPGAITNFTLKLNSPMEVKFFLTAPVGILGFVTINNLYRLEPYEHTVNGTAFLPFELTLKNNINEIDTTDYVLQIKDQVICDVVCKYSVLE